MRRYRCPVTGRPFRVPIRATVLHCERVRGVRLRTRWARCSRCSVTGEWHPVWWRWEE
jgi:hypothetical protein